ANLKTVAQSALRLSRTLGPIFDEAIAHFTIICSRLVRRFKSAEQIFPKIFEAALECGGWTPLWIAFLSPSKVVSGHRTAPKISTESLLSARTTILPNPRLVFPAGVGWSLPRPVRYRSAPESR